MTEPRRGEGGAERGATPIARLLARVVDVRPAELRAMWLAFGSFALVLTSYYVLRAVRDEMGIRGGVRALPWLFSATFVATLVGVPAWAALVARVPRRRLLPLAYRFFALALVGFFVLLRLPGLEVVAARAFFVWVSVYPVFATAIFWSLMADLFDEAQGKRLFGFVAAGGSAGALVGSALTAGLVGALGVEAILLLAAGALELAVWGIRGLLRAGAAAAPSGTPAADAPVGGSVVSGLRPVFASPYLFGITTYLFLVTCSGTFLYFLQAGTVSAQLSDSTARAAFFARVNFGSNLCAMLLQAFFTGRFLSRLGVGAALALIPPLTAVGFGAFALAPTLAVIAAVQIAFRAIAFAIGNPTRDVLFTVLGREEKYKAKAFIETVVYRGGDFFGSWAFTGLAAAGLTGATSIAAASAGLALPWLVLGLFLARRQRRLATSPPPAPPPPPPPPPAPPPPAPVARPASSGG